MSKERRLLLSVDLFFLVLVNLIIWPAIFGVFNVGKWILG